MNPNTEAREALESIRDHAKVRIEDGCELGATVWRLALEDIVRDATAALTTPEQGTSSGERIEQAREFAASVFDARARKAGHPASITMERHHAKVIRQGDGDDYDAVQAALLALSGAKS